MDDKSADYACLRGPAGIPAAAQAELYLAYQSGFTKEQIMLGSIFAV